MGAEHVINTNISSIAAINLSYTLTKWIILISYWQLAHVSIFNVELQTERYAYNHRNKQTRFEIPKQFPETKTSLIIKKKFKEFNVDVSAPFMKEQ